MKKTNYDTLLISKIIEKELNVTFENEEFPVGKWGMVDNYCILSQDTLILLECEKGQKHPNTNVLKIWPYMEDFPKVSIILLHYFFAENDAPKNRLALCEFLGKKLEETFSYRFQYVPLMIGHEFIGKELHKHNRHLMKMVLK